MRKSLTSYDFIEGPMSVLTKHETTDEVVFEPECSSYQMCLISEDFAERFKKNLHSIVFFGNLWYSHKLRNNEHCNETMINRYKENDWTEQPLNDIT